MKMFSRSQWFIILLVAVFCLISFSFRVFLPYDNIFTGDWIKFSSNDAYFHMRVVDNLVHNFPHATAFDPFFIYPGGSSISVSFFDWLLAVVIWIIGFGSPTQHTIDVVGAYFPAVLATITVIPVFFIGKALFNRWVGVLAAFLIAILPGEYMGRTILGFTDHHVAEVLFSALAALFLILAIKKAGGSQDGQNPVTFDHLMKFDGKTTKMPLIYSLLAGLFLGIYLITWLGGLLFVFIFALYFIIQIIANHFNKKSSDYLGIIGFITFLIAAVIFLPISPDKNLSLAMVAAIFIPPVMAAVSRLISSRKLETFYFPAALVVLAGVIVGVLYAVSPATVNTMWSYFLSVFSPGGSTAATTMEMQPFLSPQGTFSTAVAWGNFTTSFFLVSGWAIPGFGLISFLVLIWSFTKQQSDIKRMLTLRVLSLVLLIVSMVLLYLWANQGSTILVVFSLLSLFIFFILLIWLSTAQGDDKENIMFLFIWTLVIFIATLVQRRFAYYLAVNMAVLSAYISWQIILYAGLRKLAVKPVAVSVEEKTAAARSKKKKPAVKKQDLTIYYAGTVAAIIVVFFTVFYFNITKSVEVAKPAPYAPSNGWEESLRWMKDNTPAPLGSDEAYNNLYTLDYKYPASAYSVTSWWDYGYWITRTAHRIPSANPSQAPVPITNVANLFLSTDKALSDNISKTLGSSYIIADYSLITSKLWAVVDWAKQDQNKYFSYYYVLRDGSYAPVQLLKPDFYRTLVVRLYSFDGKAVADGKPLVITYEEKTSGGTRFKAVVKYEEFSSYKAAQDFVAAQKSGNYDIVSASPFVSPIPLPAVPDYKLVYSSKYVESYSQNVTIPEIKIFERIQ